MQRIDALLVGVLVLAVVLSAAGAVTYDDDRLASFDVTWATSAEDVDIAAATHSGSGEVETTVAIERENLTHLTFTLSIGGGAVRLQPTAVHVDILSPTNDTTSAEAELPAGPTASIEVPIDIDLTEAPNATRVSASSLDAARGSLRSSFSSTLGTGTWRIVASFAPGAPGPLGDEAHTVGGTVTLTSYEADVTPVSPEVGR